MKKGSFFAERNEPFLMLERIDNGFEISYTVVEYVRQKTDV